jgi:hypothetical protein
MKKPLEKIKLSHLHELCNTLAETNVRNVSNIKRKYLERGLSFNETLSMLEELKIVRNNSDELIPLNTISLTYNSLDDYKKMFLPILLSANGNISDELRKFLLNFQIKKEKIFFKATEIQKIKFSGTRNLLLELEFISSSADNTTYFVNPEFAHLFIKQFSNQILSPKSLKNKQIKNELIGFEAEKVIIEFELKRLLNISVLLNEIEHTSQVNVLAGYDIKSFEDFLDSYNKRIDRFIEVKAVSINDYKFFWSKNEMNIAKVFGEKYYLYLLPIGLKNTFNLEKMMIISNPFKNIYSNDLEWSKEEECTSFAIK